MSLNLKKHTTSTTPPFFLKRKLCSNFLKVQENDKKIEPKKCVMCHEWVSRIFLPFWAYKRNFSLIKCIPKWMLPAPSFLILGNYFKYGKKWKCFSKRIWVQMYLEIQLDMGPFEPCLSFPSFVFSSYFSSCHFFVLFYSL